MYTMILPADNAKLFVDQIFRIFDKDGNGSIDFKVFKISSRRKDYINDFFKAIYILNQITEIQKIQYLISFIWSLAFLNLSCLCSDDSFNLKNVLIEIKLGIYL